MSLPCLCLASCLHHSLLHHEASVCFLHQKTLNDPSFIFSSDQMIFFMGLMVYENGEETMYKMQTLLFECFRINKRTAYLTKYCIKCLDNKKMYKENRKCEHGRLKEICCECKASQICEHNKRRSTCRTCGGKQISRHNLQQSVCKKCGAGSICKHKKARSKY